MKQVHFFVITKDYQTRLFIGCSPDKWNDTHKRFVESVGRNKALYGSCSLDFNLRFDYKYRSHHDWEPRNHNRRFEGIFATDFVPNSPRKLLPQDFLYCIADLVFHASREGVPLEMLQEVVRSFVSKSHQEVHPRLVRLDRNLSYVLNTLLNLLPSTFSLVINRFPNLAELMNNDHIGCFLYHLDVSSSPDLTLLHSLLPKVKNSSEHRRSILLKISTSVSPSHLGQLGTIFLQLFRESINDDVIISQVLTSDLPPQLVSQIVRLVHRLLPNIYLSVKLNKSITDHFYQNLNHFSDLDLLAKFLFLNFRDLILQDLAYFSPTMGRIMKENPRYLALLKQNLNNNDFLVKMISQINPELVFKSLVILTSIFDLSSDSVRTIESIIKTTEQNPKVMYITIAPTVSGFEFFTGFGKYSIILNALAEPLPENTTIQDLICDLLPFAYEIFRYDLNDLDCLSDIIAKFRQLAQNFDLSVNELNLLSNESNHSQFLQNIPPQINQNNATKNNFISQISQLIKSVENKKSIAESALLIAQSLGLETSQLDHLLAQLERTEDSVNTVLSLPIPDNIKEVIQIFRKWLACSTEVHQYQSVSNVVSSHLFKFLYHQIRQQFINRNSSNQEEESANEDANVLPNLFEESDSEEDEYLGHDVEEHVELPGTIALIQLIMERLDGFIKELSSSEATVELVYDVYSGFNAYQLDNEMKQLSALSQNLVKEPLLNLIAWSKRKQWVKIVTCLAELKNENSNLNLIVDEGLELPQSVDRLPLLRQYRELANSLCISECHQCNAYNPPLYLQALTLLLDVDDLFSVLEKRASMTTDLLMSKLFSGVVTSDSTNNSFLRLINEENSFFRKVLEPLFNSPNAITLDDFFGRIHEFMLLNDLHSFNSFNDFANDFNQVKKSAVVIDETIENAGNQSALLEIFAKTDFENAQLIFELDNNAVALEVVTLDGQTKVLKDRFEHARAEAILQTKEEFNQRLQQKNDSSFVDSAKLKQFEEICGACDSIITINSELKQLGYPLVSRNDRSSEERISVLDVQDYCSEQRELLNRWKGLIESAQAGVFKGLNAHEIVSFLTRNRADLSNIYKLNTVHFNKSDPLEITLEMLCSEEIEELNQAEPSSISYYKSRSFSNLFIDLLSILESNNITLDLRNVLLCNSETCLSSVKAILFDSLKQKRVIFGVNALSHSVFEGLVKFLNTTQLPFEALFTGSNESFSDAVSRVNVLPPPNTDEVAQYARKSCRVSEILTSQIPGQGKSKYAREKTSITLQLAGIITRNDTIKVLNQFISGHRISRAKPHLHLDINEPIDIMKELFDIGKWNSESGVVNSEDFYNLCLIVFSLSYLKGLRLNGDLFLLGEGKIFLELPSIREEEGWTNLFVEAVFPHRNSITTELAYDPSVFDGNAVGAQLSSRVMEGLKVALSSDEVDVHYLLERPFAGFPPPHSSFWSFRLLSQIVLFAAQQLNYLDGDYHFSTIEDDDDRFREANFSQRMDNQRRDAINVLFGFTRKIVLLSTPVEGQDHNLAAGSMVISWKNMHTIMLGYAHSDHKPIVVPSNESTSVPTALKQMIAVQTGLHYDDRRPLRNAQVPPTEEGKIELLRNFTHKNPTLNGNLFKMANLDNYVLTNDNFMKMMLLALRLKTNIPTILVGSSGIGKTHLLKYCCFVLFSLREVSDFEYDMQQKRLDLFHDISVNAGTSLSEIRDAIMKVNELAINLETEISLEGVVSPDCLFPVLFLDEVNSNDFLAKVSLLITNRQFDDLRLHERVRIICAINPFVKSCLDSNSKLYNVWECPCSLKHYMMDFGSLEAEDEREYVSKIAQKADLPNKDLLSKLLVTVHGQLTERTEHGFVRPKRVPWMVSLRDATRVTRVIGKLLEVYNKLGNDHLFKKALCPFDAFDQEKHCRFVFLLSIWVCYVLRVPSTRQQNTMLTEASRILGFGPRGKELLENSLNYLFDLINPAASFNVVRTKYFLENSMALFVGILSKTPVILIGLPGTSKSLSLTMLLTYLTTISNEPERSRIVRLLPHHYQGSHAATTESIEKVVDGINNTVDAASDHDVVHALIMDEISLLLDAPANPLKCLHSILEPRETPIPKFSFVGISNNEFDAAPSSRAIVIQRKPPAANELSKIVAKMVQNHSLSTKISTIVSTFHTQMDNLRPEFYGMRDVYQLAKFLEQNFESNVTELLIMLIRAYGGLKVTDILVHLIQEHFIDKVLGKYLLGFFRSFTLNKSHLLTAIREAFVQSFGDYSENSRHILAIGNLDLVKCIVQASPRANDLTVIIGSQFEKDAYNSTSYRQLSVVSSAVNLGHLIVLHGTSHLIGALFDILNKNYVRTEGEKGIARIALGTVANHLVTVHPKTKIIVVIKESDLEGNKTPKALLNRLEKFNLNELIAEKFDIPSSLEASFFDYGLQYSLPRLNGQTVQELADSFLSQLMLNDLNDQNFLILKRLANPLFCLQSRSNRNTRDLVEEGFGYLSLVQYLEERSSSHPGPIFVIALSSYFGSSQFNIDMYDHYSVTTMGAITTLNELDSKLTSEAELLKAVSQAKEGALGRCLMVVRIDDDQSVQFDNVQNQLDYIRKAFNSKEFILDIAICLINPTDLNMSATHSTEGISLVYLDAVNYQGIIQNFKFESISELKQFDMENLDQEAFNEIFKNLVMSVFVTSDLPKPLLTRSHQLVLSLSQSNENYLSGIFTQMIQSGTLQFDNTQFAFNFDSDDFKSKTVQGIVEETIRSKFKEIIGQFLTILLQSNLLIPSELPNDQYVGLLDVIIASLPEAIKIQSIGEYSETPIPFIYFLCTLLDYARNQQNSEKVWEAIFAELPVDLIDLVSRFDPIEVISTILGYFSYDQRVIQYLLGRGHFEGGDLFELLQAVLKFLVDPNSIALMSALNYFKEFNANISTEFVSMASTAIQNLSLDSKSATENLLSSIDFNEINDPFSEILLNWLRIAIALDCPDDLKSEVPIESLDNLISCLGDFIANDTSNRIKLLGGIVEHLPVDAVSFLIGCCPKPSVCGQLCTIYCDLKMKELLKEERDLTKFVKAFSSRFGQLLNILDSNQERNPVKFSFVCAAISSAFKFNYPSQWKEQDLMRLWNTIRKANGLASLVLYSTAFYMVVDHLIVNELPIPFAILKYSLQDHQNNEYLGPQTLLVRRLLSTKTTSEATSILAGMISNSDGRRAEKQTLFNSINYQESDFSPLFKEVDWGNDSQVLAQIDHIKDNNFGLEGPNNELGPKFKALLSVRNFNINNDFINQFFSSFDECKSLLVCVGEALSVPHFSDFINGNLANSYIPTMLPHSAIAWFYFTADPAVTSVWCCSNCAARIVVQDCGQLVEPGHHGGERNATRDRFCIRGCSSFNRHQIGSYQQYNAWLLNQKGNNWTRGMIALNTEVLTCSAEFQRLLRFGSLCDFLIANSLVLTLLLAKTLISPQFCNYLQQTLDEERPISYLRDGLFKCIELLARTSGLGTIPQVTSIVANKIRQFNQFHGPSFMCNTIDERFQLESAVYHFLNTMSNDGLPKLDGDVPTLGSKYLRINLELLQSLEDKVIASIVGTISPVTQEPDSTLPVPVSRNDQVYLTAARYLPPYLEFVNAARQYAAQFPENEVRQQSIGQFINSVGIDGRKLFEKGRSHYLNLFKALEQHGLHSIDTCGASIRFPSNFSNRNTLKSILLDGTEDSESQELSYLVSTIIQSHNTITDKFSLSRKSIFEFEENSFGNVTVTEKCFLLDPINQSFIDCEVAYLGLLITGAVRNSLSDVQKTSYKLSNSSDLYSIMPVVIENLGTGTRINGKADLVHFLNSLGSMQKLEVYSNLCVILSAVALVEEKDSSINIAKFCQHNALSLDSSKQFLTQFGQRSISQLPGLLRIVELCFTYNELVPRVQDLFKGGKLTNSLRKSLMRLNPKEKESVLWLLKAFVLRKLVRNAVDDRHLGNNVETHCFDPTEPFVEQDLKDDAFFKQLKIGEVMPVLEFLER
ncbi:hypothetical protein P9112_010863 [Eukaryota sp. TZLM1-RC]